MKRNKRILSLSVITTLLLSLNFTACSMFNKDNVEVNKGNNALNSSINLDKTTISNNDITETIELLKDLKNSLNKEDTVYKICKEEKEEKQKSLFNDYIKNVNELDNSLISKYTDNANNDILQTYKKVIKGEGDKLWSITPVGIGYEVIDNSTKRIVIADFNFVSDTPGFKIQTFKIVLSNSGKILNMTKIDDIKEKNNTRTPLSEDSHIKGSLNDDFNDELTAIIKKIKNKNLAEKIKEDKNKITEIKHIVSNVNIKNKNIDALTQLFEDINNSDKYCITKFINYDLDANAISEFTLSIPNKDKVKNYNIKYNRILNKIESINIE